MDPLERSRRVKAEADEVLELTGAIDILSEYGRVVPTGSYYLDVMVYPDIDLYIPSLSVGQLFEIAGRIAATEKVVEFLFKRPDLPELPGGIYTKARVDHGDWGRPWKLDIWSLSDTLIDEGMEDMRRFRDRLTPELRERIIIYKTSIINTAYRTPMFSGYQVYKAFIDEGMRDFDDVTRYLIDHGIDM